MITAMLALDRLEMPTDALRAPFLQELTGNCEHFNFGDLRRILMALARCWQTAPLQHAPVDEICAQIVEKARDCDPRDFVAIPQHLGRLRRPHPELTVLAVNEVAGLVSSRLGVLPADMLRAFDGLLLLEPLIEKPALHAKVTILATKCRLLAGDLLKQGSSEDNWMVGSRLLGGEIAEPRVWSVWVEEFVRRRPADSSRAMAITEVRREAVRRWRVKQPPKGVELAMRGALRRDS